MSDLRHLVERLAEFKAGTPLPDGNAVPTSHYEEQVELAAIHKTLNVVLAEIDRLDVGRRRDA